MRGKFILAFSLLSSVLFLFSSCGMPTYHNFNYFSNTIHVSSSLSSVPGIDTDYLAVYRVIINDVDPYLSQINESSPAVLLMYSLVPSAASGLTSDFNSIYRGGSSRYYNGTPVSFESDGSLENVSSTYESKEIKLYRFSDSGGYNTLSSSPNYTWNNNGSGLFLDKYYYFAFRTDSSSDNQSFSIVMDVYKRSSASSSVDDSELDPIDSVTLRRANGDSFPRQSLDTGDFSYYTLDETYTINLYLTVNLMPGNNAEFNNIYWYELRKTSFDIE